MKKIFVLILIILVAMTSKTTFANSEINKDSVQVTNLKEEITPSGFLSDTKFTNKVYGKNTEDVKTKIESEVTTMSWWEYVNDQYEYNDNIYEATPIGLTTSKSGVSKTFFGTIHEYPFGMLLNGDLQI